MSDDLGPGDVVEALEDEPGFWATGERCTVIAVQPNVLACGRCGRKDGSLKLAEIPNTIDELGWCINHWRKIGGSRADTVRRFAEDFSPAKTPESMPA